MVLKGKRHSIEARIKMGVTKRKTRVHSINKNNQWRGEFASYGAKHKSVEYNLGKASVCRACDTPSKQVEWANISGAYCRDLNDWIELCQSCHRRWDFGRIALKINGALYKRTPRLNKPWFDSSRKKWVARLHIDYKKINLGRFKNYNEAVIHMKDYLQKMPIKVITINFRNQVFQSDLLSI